MADPSDTLGSPRPPLAIHLCSPASVVRMRGDIIILCAPLASASNWSSAAKTSFQIRFYLFPVEFVSLRVGHRKLKSAAPTPACQRRKARGSNEPWSPFSIARARHARPIYTLWVATLEMALQPCQEWPLAGLSFTLLDTPRRTSMPARASMPARRRRHGGTRCVRVRTKRNY
jgi:hypothetical protein